MDETDLKSLVTSSIAELSRRWQSALNGALRSAREGQTVGDLSVFLADATEEEFEALLRAVFLNSRDLGRGYQKAHGLAWDLDDVVREIGKLGSPCLSGRWTSTAHSAALSRLPCEPGARGGVRYCQYWREAVDGLVMGLCDVERFARHRCGPAGDDECKDVFYRDEAEICGASRWASESRWGVVPGDKRDDLRRIADRFREMNVDVDFLGLLENSLYYRMNGDPCGAAGGLLKKHLERAVCTVWPSVRLIDASPIAVIGEGS